MIQTEKEPNSPVVTDSQPQAGNLDEMEAPVKPSLLNTIRNEVLRHRKAESSGNPSQRAQDRSKTLVVLLAAAVILLLLFFVVFSSPESSKKQSARKPGIPDLGQRTVPGQASASESGSVTPLLLAEDTQPGNNSVAPKDAGGRGGGVRGSEFGSPSSPSGKASPGAPNDYALRRIDFNDPAANRSTGNRVEGAGSAPVNGLDELKKPSLIFVRTPAGTSIAKDAAAPSLSLDVPAGTRLVARLESEVQSSLSIPVMAAIEVSYSKNGETVIPAGARAVGRLVQADRSGYVSIHFDKIELPDGTTQKIDATSMSLTYGPLIGKVRGTQSGRKFLVRAFTGIGTIGSFGASGSSFGGALLADRLAGNIGEAGNEELNSLAITENVFVSVPANTRFYLVVQRNSSDSEPLPRAASGRAANLSMPTAQEFRQFLQWRREMTEMYRQSNPQAISPPAQ